MFNSSLDKLIVSLVSNSLTDGARFHSLPQSRSTIIGSTLCKRIRHLIIMIKTYLRLDPMKKPTFETLQWKLEDFYSLDGCEYREASVAY